MNNSKVLRKGTAVILFTLIVLSCFGNLTGIKSVLAQSDITNLITNGDFETGEYSANYKTTATAVSMSVVSDIKHSGEYSLYVNGSEQYKFFRQAFTVTPNTDYVMSMWVRRENVEGAYNGYVEITNGVGTPISNDYKKSLKLEPCGEWQEITISFNSGELNAMSIKVTNEGHMMWFDDISVYKPIVEPDPEPALQNLMLNGDFETGEYSANYKTTATSASMSVISDIKHSGTYSLYVNGSEKFKFFRQSFAVKPNTDYLMSMWVRRENVEGAYNGYVEMTDGVGTPIAGYKKFLNVEPIGEWKRVTMSFNSAELTTMSVKVTNEGHKMWFDDIWIYEVNTDNLIKNGDFESAEYTTDYKSNATSASMSIVSDIKHSGMYSLYVNGSEQYKFFRQAFNVTPNTDYVMSMWVRRENVDGAYRGNVEITDGAGGSVNSNYKAYLNIEPCSQWQKITINFNSENLTSMSIKVTNEGHKMWFDDIMVLADKAAIRGDFNNDGVINAEDLTNARKAILGILSAELSYADLDSSGTFDIKDLVRLKQYIASDGLISFG